MKLLDTSVAIDHLRGVRAANALLQQLIDADESIAASEVVRFELLAGVRDDEMDQLEQFCATIEWVPVDEDVARAAGTLALQHRRAYQGIDDVDYLIAGTALALGAEILTTNIRHFPMFPDLKPPY